MSDEYQKYLKNLPRKRMAAGAILFNEKGEILIVKPLYKDGWLLPGGVIEQDESPRAACVREVREEIGLVVSPLLVCVDFKPSIEYPNDDSLQFIFNCGVLSAEQIDSISLNDKEIADFKFCSVGKVVECFKGRTKKRFPKVIEAINNNTCVYLEQGKVV